MEPSVRGEGAGVGGFVDEVVRVGDEGGFFLSRGAPEEEGSGLGTRTEVGNDGVGEAFPAAVGVGEGFAGFDGEDGVEKEDALFRPVEEVAGGGNGEAEVGVELLEHVAERGRRLVAGEDGEGEAVGLVGVDVGVLAEDDDAGVFGRGEAKGVVDVGSRGIDGFGGAFGVEELLEFAKIGGGEFGCEDTVPSVADGWRRVVGECEFGLGGHLVSPQRH